MLRILLHSLMCLLGIGFFARVISSEGQLLLYSSEQRQSAPPADEFKFFCEDFNAYTPGMPISTVSGRWLAYGVDSLNARIVDGPLGVNRRLGLDSSKVATLNLNQVSLVMDNQFHLEWMLDFRNTTNKFDTIYFSEDPTNFSQSAAVVFRQDSLKFFSNQSLVAAHAWGPDAGYNHFEVFFNSRIDSAFFVVNDQLLAVVSYPYDQIGYVVFNARSNHYYLDDICHSVQVPEEECTCGFPEWESLYCNTFESYYMGPFLANSTPEWKAYNGVGHSGVLEQTAGLNKVVIAQQDSIGLPLPRPLPSKFVFSFKAFLESGVNTGAGGGVRLFLDSTRTREIMNLRFRKNLSRIESIELFVNNRMISSYNVQEFRSSAETDFSVLVDTESWNFNFFHNGSLKHSWEYPDSIVGMTSNRILTAVFYGRPGEFYKLDDICIQAPPTIANCQLSPSWEAVFCDNFDTHPLGVIESTSQKWSVQTNTTEKVSIFVPNLLENYDPQLRLPVGSKAKLTFSLNQLNTNRFRVNTFARLSDPLKNFGGNIFLRNDSTNLAEIRISDGFFTRTGTLFIYGDTTKMVDLPLNPTHLEEYQLSFLFDQDKNRLEVFFNNMFMLSSDASDSMLVRQFLMQDMSLEYQAKQQPLIVEEVGVFRRLTNTDDCSTIIAAMDTCVVAVGDSLYTPAEACVLGYLETEWEKVEDPIVAGLKPGILMQIETLGGRVAGKTIFIDQGRIQDLFLLLDRNSLELANNLCASYTSIKFTYRGSPLSVSSCEADDFAWDFFNSAGGVISTYVMDLVIESCIKLNGVLNIDANTVGTGFSMLDDFGLVVGANEEGGFGFAYMDAAIQDLGFMLDFTTCNDNTSPTYTFGERKRLTGADGRDSCFQYVAYVALTDDVCGFVVPAADSVVINVYDTLAPTLPPLDTMHFACLDDAFEAAHASLIDTSLVADNIQGNEDTSLIKSRVYLSNNPEFLEVTREWTLVDSCGNEGKTFQRFIVDLEPIAFKAPATAFINRLSQLTDTRITGMLTEISSQCGPVIDTTYTDNKTNITACRDTVIRTWMVEDSVGNKRSHQQMIIYEDTIDPVLEGLPKVTFNRLSDTTNFAIVGIPKVVSDDHPMMDTTFVDIISDSSRCYARIARTWIFTDLCGNSTESKQELVFDSRMDPIIVGLKPEIRDQITALEGAITGRNIRVSQENVAAVFNLLNANSLLLSNADCSNHVQIDFNYEGDVTPSDTSCMVNDLVWRFIDEDGDVTASYALSIDVFTCIEFIAAGDLIPASVRPGLGYIDKATLSAQLISGEPMSMEQLDSLVGSLQFDIDFTSCNDNARIRYTSQVREKLPMQKAGDPCFRYSFAAEVYDEHCGFLESMPLSINIVDTLPPMFTAPDTLYFPCVGDAYLAAIPSQINRNLIVDNIRGNEDLAGIRDTIYENKTFPFAAVTKRWSIPDKCGNISYAYQHFLVNREPINLELPDTILIARFSHLKDTSYTGTIKNVFSYCGQVDNISYVDDVLAVGPCEQTITRRWTVTDNRGNKRVADQIFIYKDTLSPELNPFGIKRLDCVEEAQDLAISGLPILKFDDHPVLSFTYKDQVFDSISCLKQILRNWEVSDPCGNVTKIQQTIEIDNRTLPGIIWPPSFVRVDCRPEVEDTTLTGSPYFPDYLCNGTKVTYKDNLVSATPCEVLYQRTWTVKTDCGLQMNNSQVIQVKDSIPPTFTAPGPATVLITDLGKLSVTGFPTAIQDNCYISNSIEYEDEWVKQPTCAETGLVMRLITVYDQCDNGQTVEQMITVLPLSTPIEVSMGVDTIVVTMDTNLIELPAGVPDSGIYTGPFVLENTFNVQEAGPGVYEVFYTIGDPDSDCAFSDSVTIIVEGPNATVDHAFLAGVSIWPNPTSAAATIRFEGLKPEPIRVRLWTSRGESIRNELVHLQGRVWDYRLPMESLPSGLYWVSFESAEGYKGYKKILKY